MGTVDDSYGELVKRPSFNKLRVPKPNLRNLTLKSVAATLAVAAAVGVCVWQGLGWRETKADQNRRDEAVKVASEQVVDLTTLTAATVDARLKQMRSRVTGSFADQLERFSSIFSNAVQTNDVKAEGKVEAAGVELISDNRASVLVASSAAITTSKQKEPLVRTYRMKVDMELHSDKWLITEMVFVP